MTGGWVQDLVPVALGSAVLVALVLALVLSVMLARAVMMPARDATITVNGTRKLATRTGSKLLASLLDNGVLIPSACAGAGTCGMCRVQVVGDGPAPLPVEAARLSPSELRSGTHLACQVTVRDDMGVSLPEDLLAADTFQCRVIGARALTPLIREIVLDLPAGADAPLFAGAFVQITAPPFTLDFAQIEVPAEHQEVWRPLRGLTAGTQVPVTRGYSIANRPEDSANRQIVLNVRLALPPPSVAGAPPGVVSSWLFALRVGQPVSVAGPFGTFKLRDNDREIVFLGGGVGMAPLRAMIHEAVKTGPASRKISFWYGARSRADVYYKDEMDTLAARHANFDWTVALSDPDTGADAGPAWDGPVGFIHTVVQQRYLASHPAPEACDYYLCGPPMMIGAVLGMLDDLGVEEDHIFNDDFGV